MRAILAVITAAIVLGVFDDAQARPYDRRQPSYWAWHSAWCLRTNDGGGDCGFATLQQCLVSRAGVGGSCDPNPFYTPPPAAAKTRKSKRAYQ